MEERNTNVSDMEFIQASLNSNPEEENIFKSYDPFNKSWDMLKDFAGLGQNFRRRTSRQVTKAVGDNPTYLSAANATPSGDGAESKQINPGTVYRNGYGPVSYTHLTLPTNREV